MNAKFTRYEIATGRGIDVLTMPDRPEWENSYFDGVHALYRGTFDCMTQFLSGSAVADRPESHATCDRSQIAADGQDAATISGLPQSCVVAISGPVSATLDVDDGELQFTASVPGVYRVSVEAFPIQRWEATIHAV